MKKGKRVRGDCFSVLQQFSRAIACKRVLSFFFFLPERKRECRYGVCVGLWCDGVVINRSISSLSQPC